MIRGKEMVVREGRVELELVYTESVLTEGVNVGDVLVHEGDAQYVGQEGAQAIRQETQAIGVDLYSQFCQVLVIVARPLPSHFKEKMEILKREAINWSTMPLV